MSINAPVRLFYILKPLIPRRLQLALRRRRAAGILRGTGGERIRPRYGNGEGTFAWPATYRAAALVTHDVETPEGQKNIPALLEIERARGIRSCWNFVADRYLVDEDLIRELRADGHEIGVHGVSHDGRLFSSEEEFGKRLKRITEVAEEWGAGGFRSPSLLYDEGMLSRLPLPWDSSIPAWDPFQPQPGGSGIYFPYMLSDSCVELPVTLWQDFTLFEELAMKDIGVWNEQVTAIFNMGGLINVIIHPDYMTTPERLGMYCEFLDLLLSLDRIWLTLPSQVADLCRMKDG